MTSRTPLAVAAPAGARVPAPGAGAPPFVPGRGGRPAGSVAAAVPDQP